MPASFGDFFKPNKDLNKFDTKKTFTLKSACADKSKLKTKFTLGKGLSIEGSKKTDSLNFKKVLGNTDGHYEFEVELNDAIADVTVGATVKVGSSKWQAKNGEELVLNLGYGNSDLAFQMDTDLIAAGSITSELDLSYSFGDFLIGGGATLDLPFAFVGGGNSKFGVSSAAVGAKWTSGDLAIGAKLDGINTGLSGAGLNIDVFHKCSSDTNYGVTVGSKLGGSALKTRAESLSANLAMETKLDATTSLAFGLNHTGNANLKYAQSVSSKMKLTYQLSLDLNDMAKDQKMGIGIEMSA